MSLFLTQSSLASDDGLSSTQATSDLVVPTNIQDPFDFRSTRNEPQKDQPQIPIYYSELNWNRIAPGFGPCPDGKGSSTSWVWNHGWRVQELGKSKTYCFLCRICFQKKGPLYPPQRCINGTGGIASHLLSAHGLNKTGASQKRSILDVISSSGASSSRPPVPSFNDAISEYFIQFNPSEFKALLLDYVVSENHAFSTLESPRLHKILTYLNPACKKRGCLPTHTTIASWIEVAYDANVGLIKELLNTSQSKIHISFDLWTSRAMRAFCAITAHFCDAKGEFRTLLLGLPHQAGRHTGVNIAPTISAIVQTFGLEQKLGWFVCDNASNNDTCIEALGSEFEFDHFERRIRCIGHVINLVARSLLFGKDPEALEEKLTQADDIELWRKRGPLGKIHNIVTWIRASPQRREQLRNYQVHHPLIDEGTGEEKPNTLELIADNNTRWNSFFYMLRRAIQQKDSITDLMEEEHSKWDGVIAKNRRSGQPLDTSKKPSVLDDTLTSEDWQMLNNYLEFLQPLEEATMILQGHGKGGSYGVIWQVIPVMEGLLKHFEQLKSQHVVTPPESQFTIEHLYTQTQTQDSSNLNVPSTTSTRQSRRTRPSQQETQLPPPPPPLLPTPIQEALPAVNDLFCAEINHGWMKLNKYYELTDRSAAYVAALVLHPAYTWSYLEGIWRFKPAWISSAKTRVSKLWKEYSDGPLPVQFEHVEQTPNKRHKSSLFDLDDDVIGSLDDEYQQWCQRPRDRFALESPPLEFWTSYAIKKTFPRLQKMALDVFTIPAMSDEPERVFSSTGLMVRPHRSRLSQKIIAMSQCLRNWSRQDLVTFQIFDTMKERLQHVETLHEDV
jgi:hypothetical protein